jgi:hypothetical protein
MKLIFFTLISLTFNTRQKSVMKEGGLFVLFVTMRSPRPPWVLLHSWYHWKAFKSLQLVWFNEGDLEDLRYGRDWILIVGFWIIENSIKLQIMVLEIKLSWVTSSHLDWWHRLLVSIETLCNSLILSWGLHFQKQEEDSTMMLISIQKA